MIKYRKAQVGKARGEAEKGGEQGARTERTHKRMAKSA